MNHRRAKRKTPFILAMVIACAPVLAQTNMFSPPLKAERLMGAKVEDTDGQKVGTLRNLIINTRTGQIQYAVIGSGGFIGVGATLRLAPSQIMSAATTKRETLSIDTALDEWKGAPRFKSSQLASLSEPNHANRIARYFAKPGLPIASTSGLPLSATGASAGAQTDAPQDTLKFVGDFIGKPVVSQQQQKIGDVVDLLVGFGQSHPAYAIISSAKFIWRAHEYAVPLTALKPSESGARLMLDVDTAALRQAPPFNQQVWENLDQSSNRGIYSFSNSGE